jgi:hypothetical protein
MPGAEALFMAIIRPNLSGRMAKRWPVAAVAAVLMAAALVATALAGPAVAISGPLKLLNAGVTPRTGTPTTSIVLTIDYRNTDGRPPAYVHAVIDGGARVMVAVDPGKTDYHHAVRYRLVTKLAVGAHTIGFTAADAGKFVDTEAAGSVTVEAPAPGDPSSGTPGGGGGSGGGTGGGDGSGGSSRGSSGGAKHGTRADPATRHHEAGGGTPATGAGSIASRPDLGREGFPANASTNLAPASWAAIEDITSATFTDGPSGIDRFTSGPVDVQGLMALAGHGGFSTPQRMLLAAIASTTTTTAAMAFLFFGKRRRDGEPPDPDEVLSANAARMTAWPSASLVPSLATAGGGAVLGHDESGMPRWRRPSLMAARKSDPLRSATVNYKLTFDSGVVGSVEGRERRRIRYRVVRLLDAPDELRSREIGVLDQGDEVALLERSGSFWLVLCPDGGQGWVHKMTLGDVVETPTLEDSDRTFAEATDEIDGDVLAAYLASRDRN